MTTVLIALLTITGVIAFVDITLWSTWERYLSPAYPLLIKFDGLALANLYCLFTVSSS